MNSAIRKSVRFAVIVALLFSTSHRIWSQGKTTELALARLSYVYALKKALGNKAWPGFGEDKYRIPVIYYAGDTTFIANPHAKFVKQFQPGLILTKKELTVYRLDYRIDTIPLRMMVSMSFGQDTALYDYNTPYMKCNSREEFIKYTPFKPNTQGWSVLILHEFFHGFQILHDGYKNYSEQHNLTNLGIGKALQNLFITQDWYKENVNEENTLLILAYNSANRKETDSLITAFFKVRNTRRSHIGTDSGFAFDFNEKAFETLEGCARFIEAYFLLHPIKDKSLMKADTAFTQIAGSEQDILNLGKVTEGDYYYATGFNIARLLEKLHVDFKSILFKEPSATLEDILWQYLKTPLRHK